MIFLHSISAIFSDTVFPSPFGEGAQAHFALFKWRPVKKNIIRGRRVVTLLGVSLTTTIVLCLLSASPLMSTDWAFGKRFKLNHFVRYVSYTLFMFNHNQMLYVFFTPLPTLRKAGKKNYLHYLRNTTFCTIFSRYITIYCVISRNKREVALSTAGSSNNCIKVDSVDIYISCKHCR